MPRYILMDELHVQVRARPDLAAPDRADLRRLLAGRPFRRRLVRAVRALFAGRPFGPAASASSPDTPGGRSV
jgi:hypothetical protein